MTLRYLLDTNIVSAAMSKAPDGRVTQRLSENGRACALAAPVWHELVYGCRRLPRGRRRDALEEYLDGVLLEVFPILPYDEAAAFWHARERARLESVGRPTPFVDGQIAAIAATRQLVLVTANPKDFIGFDGLPVEDWTTASEGRD